MRKSGQAVLLAVCFATSISARSTRNNIFERSQICPDPSYQACTGPGLPENFCCAAGNSCLSLAANTTLLCCPPGQSCQTIKPITCDITEQDVNLHPSNTLKTNALNATLPTCAGSCCPFGYSCNGVGNCVMNADQTIPPLTSSRTSTTSSASSAPTAKPATSSSPSTITPIACAKFPVTAVMVGFFPGLAAGFLLALLGVCCFRKSRKPHGNNQDRRRSGSSFGNISDPQPLDHDMRTDFLRKPPMTPSSTAGSTPGRRNTVRGRVGELFRKSRGPEQVQAPGGWNPNVAPPMPLNVTKNTAAAHTDSRPVTPPNQREPSAMFDEIRVRYDDGGSNSMTQPNANTLMPPPAMRDARRETYQTSFSDFLPDANGGAVPLAGLPKGQRELISSSSLSAPVTSPVLPELPEMDLELRVFGVGVDFKTPGGKERKESWETIYYHSSPSSPSPSGDGDRDWEGSSRLVSGRNLTSASRMSPVSPISLVREERPPVQAKKRPYYVDARGAMDFPPSPPAKD